MKWNKKYDYPTSTRALINGKRHYDVGTEEKLPSVTTILSATQSEEKKQSLANWQARMVNRMLIVLEIYLRCEVRLCIPI